jgi:hypothetical protein
VMITVPGLESHNSCDSRSNNMHGFLIYDRYVFIYSFFLCSKIMDFIRGLGSYHGMYACFTSHGTYKSFRSIIKLYLIVCRHNFQKVTTS